MSQQSFLDRPAARVLAACVLVACAAFLTYYHRDVFVAAEDTELVADDALRQCLAERRGHVDRMVEDGTISEDQAALFRARAEALCRAQTEGQGPGLPPPR